MLPAPAPTGLFVTPRLGRRGPLRLVLVTTLMLSRMNHTGESAVLAAGLHLAHEEAGAEEWLVELSAHEQACLQDFYPQRREDLPALLNCLRLVGVAVEIGVQTGVHADIFLRSWYGERLMLVDKWQGVNDSVYVDIANLQTPQMYQFRAHCEQRMSPYGGRAEIRAMWSADAAATVTDGSLDFVYLDARHDFRGVFADMTAWWPKLRRGGVFAGHDFCDGEMPEGDFFVRSAAAALFGYPIPVLQTREWDRYRSFFVIKTAKLEDRVHRLVVPTATSLPYAHEKYLPLFHDARAASRHGTSDALVAFRQTCLARCFGDCDHRLQRVTGQALEEDESGSNCVAALRTGEPLLGEMPPLDTAKYLGTCRGRCRTTCEQRWRLFDAVCENSVGHDCACSRYHVADACAACPETFRTGAK